MSVAWNPEQILALAPDPSSAKAGRGLASLGKWVSVGGDERALWGECKGSAATPYQTKIDLQGPAFHCSCPSRKFPCKHGLGLFLLYAGQPQAFVESAAPQWVSEWLGKREAREKSREQRGQGEQDEGQKEKRAASQAKRAAQRQDRMQAGLAELELWLHDLVRQGLADAPSRPQRFWDDVAARMVDAQLPGVARMLRELAGISGSGEGWMERLLERVGLLYLLLESYRRLDALPEPLQGDVRAMVGLSVPQEELEAQPGTVDRWQVLGQRVEEDDRLIVERSWLLGESSARRALLLHFAPQHQPVRSGLMPGTCFEGELCFYPSALPLRAIVKRRGAVAPLGGMAGGHSSIEGMLAAYGNALALNPWLELYPSLMLGVVPRLDGERWLLADAAGAALAINHHNDRGWKLLSMSGGGPLQLFGEWNGTLLTPLSVWHDGRFMSL